MSRRSARTTAAAALAALLGLAPVAPAGAQGVMERPPNLTGTWTGDHGVLYFNFLHRFTVASGETNKVANFPTFLLAAGLPANILAGVRYATNSDLVPAYPNEWEFFARWGPLAQERGGPLDVALHAGYNNAAESFDAELSASRAFGRIRLLAAGRYLSDAFFTGESRFAVAGGATLSLTRTFSLAADVATLTDREDDVEDIAWGAGLQIAIPYTPHTLSLQATNTNTATLQGSSIGSDETRYGFEFTIPITLSRYFGGGGTPAAAPQGADSGAAASADTVRVTMRNLAYAPTAVSVGVGQTVVWVNNDAVQHTVTADDGSFDSGIIEPGRSWARTFPRAGTIAYHCTPHPFMKATVTVR
jgi:plastocyanin